MRHNGNVAVDVLVPTRDRPTALAVTLACLLGQTHRPIRVVVADQGDTSCLDSAEVRAVVRTLQVRGVPVEVFRNLPRRGMAHQRQALLDRTIAPYALYLDDDILTEPDLVARLVAALAGQGCGFVGSFVNSPSGVTSAEPIDQLPDDILFEPWDGYVRPEVVLPDSLSWQRYRLHFAAYLHRLCDRLGITRQNAVLYRVAWLGGCFLVDVGKLNVVGGFDFWRDLPVEHAGEDVVAQLRVMARFGGAGLAPSGAWHQEIPSTRRGNEPDAPLVLDTRSLILDTIAGAEPELSYRRR
ncbi:glycosyltransferase family 2 protein [Flindersiella endophytica]